MSALTKTRPNILIVGTPGTGKSTLANSVVEKTKNFVHFDVGEIVRRHNFYESYDHDRQCHVLHKDRLLDYLEYALSGAAVANAESVCGAIVEYRSCSLFPKRWFDAVFVVQTGNSKLYARLAARNYSEDKIRENLECEILGVLLEEARNSFKPEIVHSLRSDTPDEMNENVERICQWIISYRNQHGLDDKSQ